MQRNKPYLPNFKLTDFDIETLVQPIICPKSQEIQYYETLSKICTFDKNNINNNTRNNTRNRNGTRIGNRHGSSNTNSNNASDRKTNIYSKH